MSKKHSKDTICKGCVFSIREDDKDGIPTQIGCQLGQLERARDKGLKVIECYDDEEQFNIIEDKHCLFLRPQGWVDKVKDSDMDLQAYAEAEVALEFKAMVVCGVGSTLERARQRHRTSCLALTTPLLKSGWCLLL